MSDEPTVIAVLPPDVSSRIKAGEVIDRPAAIVRELLDNSLDASATQIDVSLQGGGKVSITVADNGIGMVPDDVRCSIERHATSKIHDFDDLARVGTMGFRGEALYAISYTGHVFVHSRHRSSESDRAFEMESYEGKILSYSYPARNPGTSIEVKNIFESMPARRKSLKTDVVEFSHCKEACVAKAIAYPHVSFRLFNGDKKVLNVPSTSSLHDRIQDLWGGELAKNLIPITGAREVPDGVVHVSGFISDPVHSRYRNRSWMRTCVNRRPVYLQVAHQAVAQAYGNTIKPGAFPAVVLHLEVPPSELDINVHPTKREVRFLNEAPIRAVLKSAILEGLSSLTTQVRIPGLVSSHGVSDDRFTAPVTDVRADDASLRRSPGAPEKSPPDTHGLLQPVPYSSDARARDAYPITAIPGAGNKAVSVGMETLPEGDAQQVSVVPQPPSQRTIIPDVLRAADSGYRYVGVVFRNYLILEDMQGSMVLVDQHAAHERLNYERLKERARDEGVLDAQALDDPIRMTLGPVEYGVVEEKEEGIQGLGFDIRLGDSSTVWILSVPSFVAEGKERDVLRKVLHHLQKGNMMDRSELLHEVFSMRACKMSVKSGDSLSEEEAIHLMNELLKYKNPFSCPHGRPTSQSISLEEMKKRFYRT